MRSSNHNPTPRRGRREALDRALQLALDATGAERVFLVWGRRLGEDLEPVVEACRTRRDDGLSRPSRSLALAALERRGLFISADAGVDRRVRAGASVRAMALRFVLTAPVPTNADGRRALVLDSRSANGLRSESELRPIVHGLARLIDSLQVSRSPIVDRASPEEPSGIVGRSPVIQRMIDWIGRVAATRLPVLIRGETGSGKESVARSIRESSPRHGKPYIAFNCTALAETLLDAELFGSVRGAYTGSERDRRGLFEQADGGTLLLDEVGDMSAAMQAKLLRTLEQGRVRPVGSEHDREIDVRIMAATHRDLAREVRERTFRADLYHRLAVIEVRVPPLRERLEDLPLLIESMRPRLERETGRSLPSLSDAALERLRDHVWPGNVRELHAVLARAMLEAPGNTIEPGHLGRLGPGAGSRDGTGGQEREMIRAALVDHEGSIKDAAAEIGWTRQKLYRRIKALSLERML